jgi:hypothetical protein
MSQKTASKQAPAKPPVSLVAVAMAKDRAELLVHSTHGNLSLEFHEDGPTISIRDPQHGPTKYKAVVGLQANGHLRGFFVEKKGADGAGDTLVWFPTQKKQPKRSVRQGRK